MALANALDRIGPAEAETPEQTDTESGAVPALDPGNDSRVEDR